MRSRSGVLLFAWGPPWVWVPKFHRSELADGWSLTWLWFGICFIRIDAGTLLVDGAFPRCKRCDMQTTTEDRICVRCKLTLANQQPTPPEHGAGE
jgi:hypothetical protein